MSKIWPRASGSPWRTASSRLESFTILPAFWLDNVTLQPGKPYAPCISVGRNAGHTELTPSGNSPKSCRKRLHPVRSISLFALVFYRQFCHSNDGINKRQSKRNEDDQTTCP